MCIRDRINNLCIFKSSGSQNYTITARGSGKKGAFELNSDGDILAYDVNWEGLLGAKKKLEPFRAKRFRGTNAKDIFCNRRTNSELEVVFTEDKLQAAAPGRYLGTLTLTVEPV